MREILIGLDLGTTVFKAAAFLRGAGTCLAEAHVRLPLKVSADGGREQSPAKLDQALATIMRKLRHGLGKDWSRVAGMGLAAQGGSAIIAQRQTGKPLTPMYLWSDQRSEAEYQKIANLKSTAFWRGRTMRDLPGLGLGRMLWLKRTKPRLCQKQNLYAGAGEWIYHGLTNAWQQDACNALLQGGYNARQDKIDPDLLALAGMRPDFVAPMRNSAHPLTRAAAQRFGLEPGIAVHGPYMDHEAGYMSAASICAHPLQCSLGTAWVGNFEIAKTRQSLCPIQLVIPAIRGKGRLVIQPLMTGNVTWDWGLAKFVGNKLATSLRKANAIFQENLLPPLGMSALPWLTAVNPLGNELGGAAFVGVGPAAHAHDFLRALAASLVFEFYRVFHAVKDAGVVDSVILGGGAGQGKHFRALMAALFSPLPVYALTEPDLAGPRGALHAFCPNTARAAAQKVRLPGKSLRREINAHYKQYLQVFDRLYGHVIAGGPIKFPWSSRSKP